MCEREMGGRGGSQTKVREGWEECEEEEEEGGEGGAKADSRERKAEKRNSGAK